MNPESKHHQAARPAIGGTSSSLRRNFRARAPTSKSPIAGKGHFRFLAYSLRIFSVSFLLSPAPSESSHKRSKTSL